MPIIKTDGKLIYYAHVPKCGGSSVARYLKDRFGAVAFSNTMFTQTANEMRWSKTSPQHVDAAALATMFPQGFFDATFTIVRHPVARVISAYHFQKEVERTVPEGTGFSEWLDDLADRLSADRYVYDNHMRPMSEIVPAGAAVFFMEHGLDALIPWLDEVTGNTGGPRGFQQVNRRGDNAKPAGEVVTPSPSDLERIERIYGADLLRFGYALGSRAPAAAAPVLTSDVTTTRVSNGTRRPSLSFGAAFQAIRRRS